MSSCESRAASLDPAFDPRPERVELRRALAAFRHYIRPPRFELSYEFETDPATCPSDDCDAHFDPPIRLAPILARCLGCLSPVQRHEGVKK